MSSSPFASAPYPADTSGKGNATVVNGLEMHARNFTASSTTTVASSYHTTTTHTGSGALTRSALDASTGSQGSHGSNGSSPSSRRGLFGRRKGSPRTGGQRKLPQAPTPPSSSPRADDARRQGPSQSRAPRFAGSPAASSPLQQRSSSLPISSSPVMPRGVAAAGSPAAVSSPLAAHAATASTPSSHHSSSSSVKSSSSGSARRSRRSSRSSLKRLFRSDSSSIKPGGPDSKQQREERLEEAIQCIERNHLERLDQILSYGDIDVNTPDKDGHSLLDIAVLLNQYASARLIQLHGGTETDQTVDPNTRSRQLESKIRAKQMELSSMADTSKRSHKSLSKTQSILQQDVEHLNKLFQSWRLTYERSGRPAAPASVRVSSFSPSSILLQLEAPRDQGGAVVTNYKVEWSPNEDFSGSTSLLVPSVTDELHLTNLPQNVPCHLRAACVNISGTGPAVLSIPNRITPSSWRDLDNSLDRPGHYQEVMQRIHEAVAQHNLSPPNVTPKKGKSKPATKLLKSFKRGLYLACLAYDPAESRPLASSHGLLPACMLDTEVGGPEMAENIKWLMMLSRTWSRLQDVHATLTGQQVADAADASGGTSPQVSRRAKKGQDKGNSDDMEELLSSTTSFRFRKAAVDAAQALQHAIGQTQLGVFYPEPLRDSETGAVFLVCVTPLLGEGDDQVGGSGLDAAGHAANGTSDTGGSLTRSASTSSLRRSSSLKSLKRSLSTSSVLSFRMEVPTQPACVANRAQEIIAFCRGCTPVEPGLYLAAFLPQSTVSGIKLLLRRNQGCHLPYIKLRDGSNISKDEMAYLRSLVEANGHDTPKSSKPAGASSASRAHGPALMAAISKSAYQLLGDLRIDSTDASTYRLYTEAIDVTPSVSFLLLLPPQNEFLTETSGQATTGQFPESIAVSSSSFDNLFWHTYLPEPSASQAMLSIHLAAQASILDLRARREFNAQRQSDIQTLKASIEDVQKRVDDAQQSLSFIADVARAGRAKYKMQFPCLKDMNIKFRSTPAPPSGNDDHEQLQLPGLPKRRITCTSQGTGFFTIWADTPEGFQKRTVEATFSTTIGGLRQHLSQVLPDREDSERWRFEVITGNQSKALLDDCHPLLMQPLWDLQQAFVRARYH